MYIYTYVFVIYLIIYTYITCICIICICMNHMYNRLIPHVTCSQNRGLKTQHLVRPSRRLQDLRDVKPGFTRECVISTCICLYNYIPSGNLT